MSAAPPLRLVTPADIVPLPEYDLRHDEFRRRVIGIKAGRRVAVGRFVTFVFENFDTVHFQVQEMLRVERIVDPEKVRFEIDTYNELLPRPGGLSATMFLEIESPSERKALLPRLVGVDRAVSLRTGDAVLCAAERLEGFLAEDVERPDYASSVYFLRFPFGDAARAAFLAATAPVWLTIDHPACGASERLSDDVLAALRGDLAV